MGNDVRGNAVVTCFITLHIFGCQTKPLKTKPLKTKNERERARERERERERVSQDVVGGAKVLLLREEEKFTT
jgi:hypothetical protein